MRVAVVTQYFPTSAQPWAGHSAYQTLRRLAHRCDLQVFYPEATYPRLLKRRPVRRPSTPAWQPEGRPRTVPSLPGRADSVPAAEWLDDAPAAAAARARVAARRHPELRRLSRWNMRPCGIGEDLRVPVS